MVGNVEFCCFLPLVYILCGANELVGTLVPERLVVMLILGWFMYDWLGTRNFSSKDVSLRPMCLRFILFTEASCLIGIWSIDHQISEDVYAVIALLKEVVQCNSIEMEKKSFESWLRHRDIQQLCDRWSSYYFDLYYNFFFFFIFRWSNLGPRGYAGSC